MSTAERKKIILNGPDIYVDGGAYGGGVGGAARSVQILLNAFQSSEFFLEPCFNSIRKAGRLFLLAFPFRLTSDVFRVFRRARGATGVHIIGHYSTAIYREIGVVLVSRLVGARVLYHMKAGNFIEWYESCRPWERWMMRRVLSWTSVIACEGEVYVRFLRERLGVDAHYFPNFVLSEQVPANVSEKLTEDRLRILFVGYCYEGKGVFELVEGCRRAAGEGVAIELSLVGREEESFAAFLDGLDLDGLPLVLNRAGQQRFEDVLGFFDRSDVFCMATKHVGEGHTNAVNEAMMMGMVVLATRHGFLESVLREDGAYFLDELTPDEIARRLQEIAANREQARARARFARQRLLENFTSDVMLPRLEAHYRTLAES